MAEEGDDLKLLGMRGSPHVLRVRLALRLKGVNYDYVEQDPRNDNHKIGDLLRHSTVPVLLFHGGKPVSGSLNIIQYVDEAFANAGPSLLPARCHARAVARYWADFIDDTLIEAMYKAAWGKTEEEKTEGKNQEAAAVEGLEGALRECSKPFFAGDNLGYVDVVLGSLLSWVRATDATWGTDTFDPATTPLLATWRDRFGALDAAQGFMPDVEKLVGFATMMPASHRERLDPIISAITVLSIILIVFITWIAI